MCVGTRWRVIVVFLGCAGVMASCGARTRDEPAGDAGAGVDAGGDPDAAVDDDLPSWVGQRRCDGATLEQRRADDTWAAAGDCSATGPVVCPDGGWPVLRWDGEGWGRGTACLGDATDLVGEPETGVVWLAASAILWRWDGTVWLEMATLPDRYTRIWFDPGNGLWAYGWGFANPSPSILWWDGASFVDRSAGLTSGVWSMHSSPGGPLWTVAGSSAAQWDGARWTPTPVPEGVNPIFSIWSSGPDDAWGIARGPSDAPVFLRWNGETWGQLPLPDGYDLVSVAFAGFFGFAPDDLWLSGGLHWDGESWTALGEPRFPGSFYELDDGTVMGLGGRSAHLWCGEVVEPGYMQAFRLREQRWITVRDGLGAAFEVADGPFERLWGTSERDLWILRGGYQDHSGGDDCL